MHESLSTPASALLAADISPAGILKEFCEATGVVQKAEPLAEADGRRRAGGGGLSG